MGSYAKSALLDLVIFPPGRLNGKKCTFLAIILEIINIFTSFLQQIKAVYQCNQILLICCKKVILMIFKIVQKLFLARGHRSWRQLIFQCLVKLSHYFPFSFIINLNLIIWMRMNKHDIRKVPNIWEKNPKI